MTATESPLDGRVARRERNENAVLDVVIEMFAEDLMWPTIEEASKRSGLSLRSLYRYFADPGELVEAAVKRNRSVAAEYAHLPTIGQGPLDKRIGDFVDMRIRLWEKVGAVHRASAYNAPRHPQIQEQRRVSQQELLEQFERQFAAELSAMKRPKRDAVVSTGDLLTQLAAIEALVRDRELSITKVRQALQVGLERLLTA